MLAPREYSWFSSGLAEFQAVLKNLLDIFNTAQNSGVVQGSGWRSGKMQDKVFPPKPEENNKKLS